jgi:F-type H+-transporting ATPase subunit b
MEINATLIGQLLTFILLVWFTMRYVWPPITKAMHEREMKIAAGLEAAARSQSELELAEQRALTLIHDAKLEANKVIDLAHKRALQIVDDAKIDARQESTRILDGAKSEIAKEVSQAKEQLRQQVVSLAVAGAEKIIGHNLDGSAQTDLLNEFVAQI